MLNTISNLISITQRGEPLHQLGGLEQKVKAGKRRHSTSYKGQLAMRLENKPQPYITFSGVWMALT